ncbi:MAG: hypothetical protein D6761_02865 [Candidatus Dadabacteria bacterium]|nr:MAG: hypothetical protein D6761_02865 [Candidatus Dadabacteria bacterium]
MANLLNIDELKARQQELIDRARTLIDRAVESGRSYVEVTRSNIEAEVEDLLGKVRDYSARGQELVQSQVSRQLEAVQALETDIVGRTEALLEQYGPELEKRVPAAASLVEFADQIVKSADDRFRTLLQRASELAVVEAEAEKAAAPAPAAAAKTTATAANPIKDYDKLNAQNAIKALSGLSREQLEAVRAYEAAHKNRKTVLAAIDEQLSA